LTATATISGAVTYFVPKNNTFADASYSAISGDITTAIATAFHIHGSSNLTSIVANNVLTLGAAFCSSLTSIISPKVVSCDAHDSSLTAKAIGEILYAAYLEDRQNVYFNFSGGTNAYDEYIDFYLYGTYGVALGAVVDRLDVTGTIILNNI